MPCGDDGYAAGFGERYCYAFKNAPFSTQGERWRDSVMLCLQQALVPKLSRGKSMSCTDLFETAFASHPKCYTQPSNSICFLPPSDIATIFATIGKDEALRARTLLQMTRVVQTCVGQFIFAPFLRHRSTSELDVTAPDAPPNGVIVDDLLSDDLRASFDFWRTKAEELGITPGSLQPVGIELALPNAAQGRDSLP